MPQAFDHERLDDHRVSIGNVPLGFEESQSLTCLHHQAHGQWLRASRTIPLKIAEGNANRGRRVSAIFFAVGSASDCAAI